MRYLFTFHLDAPAMAARTELETRAAMAAHDPYIERLRKNRQYVAGNALALDARTLRTAGGKVVATEGPFVESREQLGGYYVVEAADLDVAIELARQSPAWAAPYMNALEIRPIVAALDGVTTAPARFFVAAFGDGSGADAWHDHVAALARDGQLHAAALLAAPASTTSLVGGQLGDGPHEPGRPQLARYCIVGARDRDDACAIAARSPDAATHAIEVRAVR